MPLTAMIEAQIEKRFAEPDRPVVRDLLSPLESEQVHLAILRLSRGQAKRVEDLVKAAQRDYRDVLAWSQQPTRKYIVGILRKGPNWTDEDQRRSTHLSRQHIKQWKTAKAIFVGGMFVDFNEPRGLYIFTVDSVEEAQALVQNEPNIVAGKVVFEFHPWRAPELRITLPDEL